jgi:hypothetical protein
MNTVPETVLRGKEAIVIRIKVRRMKTRAS